MIVMVLKLKIWSAKENYSALLKKIKYIYLKLKAEIANFRINSFALFYTNINLINLLEFF